jgi:hypothetical protein
MIGLSPNGEVRLVSIFGIRGGLIALPARVATQPEKILTALLEMGFVYEAHLLFVRTESRHARLIG